MAAQPASARRIVANTSALSAASLWRIGVAFALQVVVGRVLGAAGLGAYALGMALLNVAQVCVEAGLPALLVRELAPVGSPRRSTYGSARTIMIAVALTIALLAVGSALTQTALGMGAGATTLAILSLSLPFYALQASSLTMFEASERFELVLLFDGLANGTLLVAGFMVLWAGGGLRDLFATLVVVQALISIPALLAVRRLAPWFAHGSDAAVSSRSALLRRARPTFGLAVTDVLQQRVDLLLVGLLATPAVTGLYAAASALVRVLIKLAQAWWRALFPTLSRLRASDCAQAGRLEALATRLGTLAMLLTSALLATAAGPLLELIFGSEYGDAGAALRLLVWSAPVYLLLARAVVLLLVEGRSRAALLISVTQVVAVLLLLPVALFWRGTVTAVAFAVVTSSVVALLPATYLLATTRREGEAQADSFPTIGLRSVVTIGAAALAVALIVRLPLIWPIQSLLAFATVSLLCASTGMLRTGDFSHLRRALRPAAPA